MKWVRTWRTNRAAKRIFKKLEEGATFGGDIAYPLATARHLAIQFSLTPTFDFSRYMKAMGVDDPEEEA